MAKIALIISFLIAMIATAIRTMKNGDVLRLDKIINWSTIIPTIVAVISTIALFGDPMMDLMLNSPGESPLWGVIASPLAFGSIAVIACACIGAACCVSTIFTSMIIDRKN